MSHKFVWKPKFTQEEREIFFSKASELKLDFYQKFYEAGKSTPKGYPWKIDLVSLYNVHITISASYRHDPRMTIYGRDPIKLFDQAMLLEQAHKDGKKYLSTRACCILAERRSCVCIESFNCPIHGVSCYGSHD